MYSETCAGAEEGEKLRISIRTTRLRAADPIERKEGKKEGYWGLGTFGIYT